MDGRARDRQGIGDAMGLHRVRPYGLGHETCMIGFDLGGRSDRDSTPPSSAEPL